MRAMTAADLLTVLGWRNHPDVRRHMFTQHEIGLEEHRRWFEGSAGDPHRHLLIYEAARQPLGFVSLNVSDDNKVADWGFYAAPDAPKGTGRAMGCLALDHAFGQLAVHKVCGRAIEDNLRSVSFHVALGFTQEGVLREQYFDGQRYRAVVCFGLIDREWSSAARD